MKKTLQTVLTLIIVAGATIGIGLSLTFLKYANIPRFTKIILATSFPEPGRIFGTDVDGDGDIDLISASNGLGDIVWWENDELNFTQHIIDNNFPDVFFIKVGDVDLDGDPDVLGPSWAGDQIAWWENNDSIFVKHVIAVSYESAYSINTYDVDMDGDNDILSTGLQEVTWWENDGNQTFTEHTISTGDPEISQEGHASIFAADLDNDNDVDIITGATSDVITGEICCWENDGSENFTKIRLTTNYARVHDLQPIDMDNDGDIDICSNSATQNTNDWFENRGNLIFIRHKISDCNGPNSVFPIDFDKDGDFDVISVAFFGDSISWNENYGNLGFSEHIVSANFDGASSCSAIDINNDNKIDILGTAWDANEVAIWVQL
ncbi:MAG: FG-GAP repeat domain-containing protein [Candidatus Hermodarchaeota archaeon]